MQERRAGRDPEEANAACGSDRAASRLGKLQLRGAARPAFGSASVSVEGHIEVLLLHVNI